MSKQLKLTDINFVRKQIAKYFSDREQQQEVRELRNGDKRVYRTPPSILGLCKYLGISHDCFDDMINMRSEKYDAEISEALIDARDCIAQELLEGIQLGYWNEKITFAQLVSLGVLGNESDSTVKVIIQGDSEWSR